MTLHEPAIELVRLRGVTKRYPGVTALDDVDLSVVEGEVHGLIGENGAGKSTLIKVLSGVERSAGEYTFGGEKVELRSPRDARERGISVLHQERHLVPTFTVGENVLLDDILSRRLSVFNKRNVWARSRRYLDLVGLDLDPSDTVDGLSSAQQQLVEIARALSVQARLLILDEPTASLAFHEAADLLRIIDNLRAQRVSTLFVSHKLEEVTEICDRVTILRDGRVVGEGLDPTRLSRDDLVTRMIGRTYVSEAATVRALNESDVALQASGLHGVGSPRPASFVVRRGEILGWYGLVGAGRTELARLIVGAERSKGGSLRVDGHEVSVKSVADALRHHGIGYVTEDRQGEGLFLLHTIARNVSATTWSRLRNRIGFFDPRAETRTAEEYRRSLSIRTPDVSKTVGSLSGGNKQKVSLAKWLVAGPRVLIIDEPTVGIDIATKQEIHDLVTRLADQGVAIVLISSDLPEMIGLADRVLVFRHGEIVADLSNSKDYQLMSALVMQAIIDDRDDVTAPVVRVAEEQPSATLERRASAG
jgi:ribose transport system ATP-binding protein